MGAQNFALFLPSPAQNFVLSLSFSGSLLAEFWWCLEAPGPSNVHVWIAQACTFEGYGLHKNHQNSTRRHTVREIKSENGGGRGKKSEILGVRRRGSSDGQSWTGRSGGRVVRTTQTTPPPIHTTTHNTHHTTTTTTTRKSMKIWTKKTEMKHTRATTKSAVRLRPISTSASWPKSNCPKSNWWKSSILLLSAVDACRALDT